MTIEDANEREFTKKKARSECIEFVFLVRFWEFRIRSSQQTTNFPSFRFNCSLVSLLLCCAFALMDQLCVRSSTLHLSMLFSFAIIQSDQQKKNMAYGRSTHRTKKTAKYYYKQWMLNEFLSLSPTRKRFKTIFHFQHSTKLIFEQKKWNFSRSRQTLHFTCCDRIDFAQQFSTFVSYLAFH